MNYYTAKSYQSYKRIGEPFLKGGKLYTNIERPCDRCVKGIFPSRIENGVPVPHPAYGGVCLKCNGSGIIRKTVRLYNEKEYGQMVRANQLNEDRKAKARERALIKVRENWLLQNGFDEEGNTRIIYGNTYPIKDQLKAEGYKFSKELQWHGVEEIEIPEDCEVAEVSFYDIYEWKPNYRIPQLTENGKEFLHKLFSKKSEFSDSEYVGEVGERLRDMECVLVNVAGFDGRYGYTYCYTFLYNGNVLNWFTQKYLEYDKGAKLIVTGTVKKHDTYKDYKVTYLSRCKISE